MQLNDLRLIEIEEGWYEASKGPQDEEYGDSKDDNWYYVGEEGLHVKESKTYVHLRAE